MLEVQILAGVNWLTRITRYQGRDCKVDSVAVEAWLEVTETTSQYLDCPREYHQVHCATHMPHICKEASHTFNRRAP